MFLNYIYIHGVIDINCLNNDDTLRSNFIKYKSDKSSSDLWKNARNYYQYAFTCIFSNKNIIDRHK